jgi:hypothetical protein
MNNPQMPPGMPPELAAQLKEAMEKRGGALPPGMFSGSPGIDPEEYKRRMMYTESNPLPPGDQGMKILRALYDCGIPAEAKRINEALQKLVEKDVDDDEASELIESQLARGMALALRAPRTCKKQLTQTVVVDMKKDIKLSSINKDLANMQEKAIALQEELQELFEKANEMTKERWDYCIKHYGLVPEKYAYIMNEEEQCVERCILDCTKCEGLKVVKETSAELNEFNARLDEEK